MAQSPQNYPIDYLPISSLFPDIAMHPLDLLQFFPHFLPHMQACYDLYKSLFCPLLPM